MLKIGLTGGIGSGKSTAANFFRAQNIDVVDLDQLARDVVEPDGPALQEIRNHFGELVLTDNKELNRQKLGQIIFNNPAEKIWLESLLHPLINNKKQKLIEQSQSDYIIIEIPLLAENHRQSDVDRVLLVDCDEQLQIDRALARGQQPEEQIKKIISLQASRDERKAVADDVIENNGTTKQLEQKLTVLHQRYLTSLEK